MHGTTTAPEGLSLASDLREAQTAILLIGRPEDVAEYLCRAADENCPVQVRVVNPKTLEPAA